MCDPFPIPGSHAAQNQKCRYICACTGEAVLDKGADADLVILDEHNKIRDVMTGGTWHRQHGKQLLKCSFESD